MLQTTFLKSVLQLDNHLDKLYYSWQMCFRKLYFFVCSWKNLSPKMGPVACNKYFLPSQKGDTPYMYPTSPWAILDPFYYLQKLWSESPDGNNWWTTHRIAMAIAPLHSQDLIYLVGFFFRVELTCAITNEFFTLSIPGKAVSHKRSAEAIFMARKRADSYYVGGRQSMKRRNSRPWVEASRLYI